MTDLRNKPATANTQGDNGAIQQRANAAAQQSKPKEVQISQTTKEKADAAKEYIESNFPLTHKSKITKKGILN